MTYPTQPRKSRAPTDVLTVAETLGMNSATGKTSVRKLGRGFRNASGRRKGFTCRLPILPEQRHLVAFREDHQPLPENSPHTLRVYAVVGRMPAYARKAFDWQPHGTATLRDDRLGYDIAFDHLPPTDAEGHLVFSLLERQVGDVDHEATKQLQNDFLSAIQKDMVSL